MFSFEYPWLIFLLPLPLLVWKWLPAQQIKSETIIRLRFPSIQRLQQAFVLNAQVTQSPRREYLLLSVIWFALIIAGMSPQWIERQTEIRQSGYDLMLAVDLSGSMRQRDFFTDKGDRIDRLEAAKQVLSPFITQREGDRIGLILFADEAYLQSPLTLDVHSVQVLLQRAVLGLVGRETAIGDAIGLAVRHLRERPENSRVLILLTDGNNTAGQLNPMDAAKLAQQYHIRIYTIGVGSRGLYEQALNEKPLQEISELTGGSYFPATDLDALSQVYQHINKNLLKTEAETRTYIYNTPLYHLPLGLALIAWLFWQWRYGRRR